MCVVALSLRASVKAWADSTEFTCIKESLQADFPSLNRALLMARLFIAALFVGLVVLQIHADLAGDIKPIVQMAKPTLEAINEGSKAAATNVKAAVQNVGAAAQQCGNGVAKIAGAATVGAGKTCAKAPMAVYQLIKQLEKKGMSATILKIIFGPPEKKKRDKKGGKAASSEED
ncbi:hypothetical protein L596_017849 [Steinernema carpocapsae]|uniref:Uncharacterized protein n=2 Tax=Steinernema carpocapsae TaxID=34508 RepID=A0A4U5N3N7_STECR|nr:hypothetical protein L596_017849 [Steinernema carpocapsae]